MEDDGFRNKNVDLFFIRDRVASSDIWYECVIAEHRSILATTLGIATRCELDGPGIESGGDDMFRTRSDRPWSPPILLYSGYLVSLPGVR